MSQRPAHHLPGDLFVVVMSMLPVKSLLRFRSVSKTWRSLIDNDDRQFHLQHLSSFNKTPTHKLYVPVLLYPEEKGVVAISTKTFEVDAKHGVVDVLPYGWQWLTVCAVDGLYMLRKSGNGNSGLCEFMLWNPSIRKYRILPTPPQPETQPPLPIVVYDVGLGFDPVSKDYKYVGFASQFGGELYSVWIYSLGTNSWKPNPFKTNGWPNLHGMGASKVCFRGVLYSLLLTNTDVVASYDLNREEFCFTGLPPKEDENDTTSRCQSLTLANGGTCLALVTAIVDERKGTIWLSQELGGEDRMVIRWTKAYTFASRIPENHPIHGYMGFLHLNDEDGELLLSWPDDFVTSYNLKTHEEKVLVSKIEYDVGLFFLPRQPYVESLLLLS